MPFPQARAGAQRILGGWRWSGWLWCCGRSCWWCSRRMTKRSSQAGSGRGRRRDSERSVKVVALLLKPILGLFGRVHGTESWCHTQGLPPATWLHQGITTLYSTSRYTLVLTFKPTSKMWGGMMWPSLETTPKTITELNHPDLHFEGAGNGPVLITWIGRERELYSGASPISLVEHCVTFRHERKLPSLLVFVHNWQTSRWSATTKKRRSVFIKQKWNHVFSWATILSFHYVIIICLEKIIAYK